MQTNDTASTNGIDPEKDSLRLIVIGASSGGFEALTRLVEKLPHPFPAAILIVWHIAPSSAGVLPTVFNRISKIFAANAYDREPLKANRIYVAPPDHHLLVEDGIVRITKGPKEHRFRPAVDPLFRSAAYAYRQRVIGVILSGALDDGTAGLSVLKRLGGIAVVQNPLDAEIPSMPRAAMKAVAVDHVASVTEMPGIFAKILAEPINNSNDMKEQNSTRAEVQISMGDSAFEAGIMNMGELTPFTCPECHGVLSAVRDGTVKNYRCHTGHAFSADSLLDAITLQGEEGLYDVMRGMEESIMLLNHMGDHLAELNNTSIAARYFQQAQQVQNRIRILRTVIHDHQRLNVDLVESESSTKQEAAESKDEA